MKNKFVHTNNVKQIYNVTQVVTQRDHKTPGLSLVYGKPGLGKTEACHHISVQNDYICMRAKASWTPNWFLNDLLNELEEEQIGRIKHAYNRLKDVLTAKHRLVFIDEVDHMLRDGKVIETMRDLHDETGNPFVLVGMQDAERKLKRHPHLYSRFATIVKVQPIDPDEIMRIASELMESDIKLDKSAAQELYRQSSGELRKIVTALYKIERLAKSNDLQTITKKHLTANG